VSGWNAATSVIAVIAGSSLLAAFAGNWQSARQHRKEIVAGATRSALRRKEMYYRVRRRRDSGEDDVTLRDLFHDIQEENDQYITLLDIEAPWLGDAYRRFLTALKAELQPFMTQVWAPKKAGGADVQLLKEDQPEVDRLVRLFAQDGRRLFNPLMRPIMRAHYSLCKNYKDKYAIREV
jgi:hypothetical protein